MERWARLHELEAAYRRVEAEMVVLLAEAKAAGEGRVDGHRSLQARCRAEFRWAPADVTARMQLVRLLEDLPAVVEALGDGRIGVAQARAFGRARANPRCGAQLADHAGVLLEHARTLGFEDFHRCISRWEQLADMDGAHQDAEASHENRYLTLRERDGVVHLEGQGGALPGAELVEILRRFAEVEFDADWRDARERHGDDASVLHLARSAGQRRWDALHRIFQTAAQAEGAPRAGESTLNMVMDLTTYEEAAARLGLFPMPGADAVVVPWDLRRCETTDGILLDPVQAVRASLFAHVRRVVMDGAGTVIDLGRRRRLFTGAAREAVLLATSHCVHPGCLRPVSECQVDHRAEWDRDGGATDAGNGAPECGPHNRHKHREGYQVERDPGGVWHTYRPDGSEIAPSPPPAPPDRWAIELDHHDQRRRAA